MAEAIKSPSMLSHYITLKYARTSLSKVQRVYGYQECQLTLEPLPVSMKGITDSNKWIFSFFSANLEKNQFVCRLWHKSKPPVFCPEVFFKDGTLLTNRLLQHLRFSHYVNEKLGQTKTPYVDVNGGKVIELDRMPVATMQLIELLLNTSKFSTVDNFLPSITFSGEIENSSFATENIDVKKCIKTLKKDIFKLICFFNPIGGSDVICRMHHLHPAVISCIDKSKPKNFSFSEMKTHISGNHNITKSMIAKNNFAITPDGIISLNDMVNYYKFKNSSSAVLCY